MVDKDNNQERREFLRFSYDKPLRYRVVKEVNDKSASLTLMNAISKNLSASGIFFTSKINKRPDITNLLVIEVDYKTADICKEIEDRVLILKNKILGRVVRMEDNGDGTCGIGVAFVTKSDPMTKNIKSIENLIK